MVTQAFLPSSAGDLASLASASSLFAASAIEKLERLQAMLKPLAVRYDVVVANPPYMGAKNMNKWLGDWVKENYSDVKGDLFSCFMVRNSEMGNDHSQMGFMTPYVWMFISTYEKLRRFVIEKNTITSLIQLEYSGFAGATVPICTFTLQKGCVKGYKGGYIRLSDFVGADQQAPRALEALANPDCGWFFRCDADAFNVVPGSPIAYWITNAMKTAFLDNEQLGLQIKLAQGLATTDNKKYLRIWWELNFNSIDFSCLSTEETIVRGSKWFPYNKGGDFRKWYGNNDYVVNYQNDGEEIKKDVLLKYPYLKTPDFVVKNTDCYFKPSITWTLISSSFTAFRYKPPGHIFDVSGMSMFPDEDSFHFVLGFCNSSITAQALQILAPTLNFQLGDIYRLPLNKPACFNEDINKLVQDNIALSQEDWDSFETSWDFKRHPLI